MLPHQQWPFLSKQFQAANRIAFYSKVQADLQRLGVPPSQIETILESYKNSYRGYVSDRIYSTSRSSQFLDQALKEISPQLKVNTTAKVVLRAISKVFLQELAESCIEVMEEQDKRGEIDLGLLDQAYLKVKKRNNTK